MVKEVTRGKRGECPVPGVGARASSLADCCLPLILARYKVHFSCSLFGFEEDTAFQDTH